MGAQPALTVRPGRSATARDGGRERRLVLTVEHAAGRPLDQGEQAVLAQVPAGDPNELREAIARLLPGQVAVTGSVEARLLLAERVDGRAGWTIADLSGRPHAERRWPAWTAGRILINSPQRWLSAGSVTAQGAERLARPRVLLGSLYHPEWFPLPRFPLAISDLARAARRTLMGQVQLMDMQLGVTRDDLVAAVTTTAPDIVGVSATFGQHDLLVELLDVLYGLPVPPLVVAGGSLTARNEALLLGRYPQLLIARGAGEPTIADALGYFHHDLDLADISGLGYTGAARGGALQISTARKRTATVPNARQDDFLPELDLLEQTLVHRGVAQLEASRGCTSACAFCPRSHKGAWAAGSPDQLGVLLPEIRRIFDRHPGISRTLYLVDEEFIGRDPDAVPRALALAATVHSAGFSWESSCRVDQVVRPDESREWHINRAHMWRGLAALGLRRMLFGVESGVTSVLERFKKNTTGEQNALAIRTLTALGIPTRFTYITFDQLMSFNELAATHSFQGRTDLLLHPQPLLSVEEIVDGVSDPSWVAAHSTGRPLYSGISYMLVVMECLIGAAYTRAATERGLTGAVDPSMGRVEARFADERIGACARHGQLWVDRHFALDYTLKSLEKLVDGRQRAALRSARIVIRTASYRVLTGMLALIDTSTLSPPRSLGAELGRLLDIELDRLRMALDEAIPVALRLLPEMSAAILHTEHQRWSETTRWRLINAGDACGT